MKKSMVTIILLFQVFLLIACTSQIEKDALEFIDQLYEVNISSEYNFESVTYGVYLSNDSETVYQYKFFESNYYINVLEERSFSYFDEDSDDYSNAQKIKHIFFVDTTSKKMYSYNFDSFKYEELMDISEVAIQSIILVIHHYLENDGEVIGFDQMYPIIYEALYIGKEHGKINAYGASDLKVLTFTLPIDTYLKYAIKFKQHLLTIYGIDKYNMVIESMENSPYKDLHLNFRWDSSKEIIVPIFQLNYRQIDYYKVEVFPSSFNEAYIFD